jgi:hypothetical protein
MNIVEEAATWILEGAWQNVSSSNVKAIMYKSSDECLLVEFRDGSIYEYKNVPDLVAIGMFSATSHGKYVHKVLSNYDFEKIH